ncbi:hypothetical protein RND81_10G016900 [Saponaria officinalis]|uniref:Cysteine-rich receptor-like protein kinase 10 n=1 Tax=Saponaria officinalis TaxID=3572 RepID=A0AAW1HXM0_SAPOF
MIQHSCLIYFLFTLMSIIPKSSSTPAYLVNVCSNTTLFASKSRYQTNLNTLFDYLSSNATNPNGYHAATAGNGTNDVVYGHFLCRGDQSPGSCQDCVSTATTTDLPKTYCPNSKVAIIWYDECMVRYSNVSFFGVLSQNEGYTLYNTQNITGNSSQFMDVMGNMMNDMVIRAINGGPKKFATNYTTYSSLVGIYGLEQCTPDISASDCDQCLVTAIQTLPISKGGRVLGSSCNARFEVYPFFNGALNLSSPPAPPPLSKSNSTGKVPLSGKSKTSTKVIVSIVVPVAVLVATFLAISIYYIIMKPKKNNVIVGDTTGDGDFSADESLQYDLSTLKSATNNFSIVNKLGEGGFGSVYKGTLSNGEEVAVKRLARSSGQGVQEFKTELLLVAKLQHRNLARLLGFCLAGDEKLLVYEYAPNKSLDNFVFDPVKQGELNWGMRYNIIQGIARGILYLHQDSRLKIIHRDLKASNILLDASMNAKISDFGMARIFGGDQSQSNTSRVVGTFGYMSPEYVMHGQYSTKSDVYSFGVLILEIISGKRNNSFYESGYAEDLLSYAWKLWEEGKPLMLVDEAIRDSYSNHEVMRCVHLGLLCVQDSVQARPTIETVVLSLDSFTVTLPLPTQPAFFSKVSEESFIARRMVALHSSGSKSIPSSRNDVSVSEIEPR